MSRDADSGTGATRPGLRPPRYGLLSAASAALAALAARSESLDVSLVFLRSRWDGVIIGRTLDLSTEVGPPPGGTD